MLNINFWNGNKTRVRQGYETELLEACISATAKDFGSSIVQIDNTNYPVAEDESNVFANGTDILVTVAGNLKFEHQQKIIIPQPLTKGLLGYRLILIRNESLDRFSKLESTHALQTLSIGIPRTWADAEMFRQNRYRVVENGTFDDLFVLLKSKAFDYTALGANEIEDVFKERVVSLGGISIEPSTMIYYPYPLVFYVNPSKPQLAERVASGLKAILDNGQHEQIFHKHHGDVVQRLNLKQRKIFTLKNPILPPEMQSFTPTLLD
jgi:hypothetical protein